MEIQIKYQGYIEKQKAQVAQMRRLEEKPLPEDIDYAKVRGLRLEAAEKLAQDGISAEVINICTIKPLDEELIIASAKKTGKVVTAEEHSVIGGLGSAVCDALCKAHPVPVCKIGMQDVFGESGSAAALIEKYELDGAGIYRTVKEFVRK